MEVSSRVYVAGHTGLVGSAIVRALKKHGFCNIISRTRAELDLLNQADVNAFFKEEEIDYVFVAAAKVGGILFNQRYQADFLYENMQISLNVLHAAANSNVQKLLYLGSSCIYPRLAPQPIKEDSLLSGPLEPTNEGYALAKISGLKFCEKLQLQYGKRFISAMPTNLYGPGDNYHPEHSHVIPGLIRKFHDAKIKKSDTVTIWGSGTPRREFLFVDDLAEGLLTLMEKYEEPQTINVGTGEDCTIAEVAQQIAEVVGFKGQIAFDTSKPDGTPRKLLNVDRIKALGWSPQVSLKDGLKISYQWALENNKL
ncbi:MAG: GDP-L-fucose synthase family protein [Bdellovibrionota bacterium]|jgi:GDP-L-fucose synthase